MARIVRNFLVYQILVHSGPKVYILRSFFNKKTISPYFRPKYPTILLFFCQKSFFQYIEKMKFIKSKISVQNGKKYRWTGSRIKYNTFSCNYTLVSSTFEVYFFSKGAKWSFKENPGRKLLTKLTFLSNF